MPETSSDDAKVDETTQTKETAEESEKKETAEKPENDGYEPGHSYEDFVHKEVKEIVFGVLSPQMIKKMATVKIVTPELYDREGYPVDGGLMDVKMGVIDPGLKCPIDGKKLKDCPGYFGYIELARPVIHINFVKYAYDILRSTCKECGRILLTTQKLNKLKSDIDFMQKKEDYEGIRALTKSIMVSARAKSTTKCPHCKAKQEGVKLEKPTTFMENEKRLSPIEVRTRLEKVTDDDCFFFGLNPKSIRPEWMVLTIMPIPPVTMRPSITLESGERSEDDLTHKLGDIVRINQRLFENINAGAPEIIIEDLWDLLQYHITTFFDNNIPQIPPARHRSGQPLKTITERVSSKEGRIRHNLAGKRTNFSARTAISPDPMLEINEVGVPQLIAMNLTVPERVTAANMEYLKQYIKRGPKEYPGCNYIIRPDGRKKRITDETQEASLEELQPGYIVERHLMDGDIALFNRQPSLHRMSMMCHKVRVLPGKTLRLNPAVCVPYNADFDGDEMNLHIPQTEEARAEAEILMLVQTQMISPRYGLSIIGCTQDAISGNYILTKGLKLKYKDAVDLLYKAGIKEFGKLPKKEWVDGKEVFSVLLPDDFNFTGHSKIKPDPLPKKGEKHDYNVIIEDGKLISGVMDQANLGEGSGLLLRNLYKVYGPDKMIEFMGKIFRLGIEVLLKTGFSVGLSQTDMPKLAREAIDTELTDAVTDVNQMIADFHADKLEPYPGRSVAETLELNILERLNSARNKTGKIVQDSADKSASLIVMIDSGARGKNLNLAQMSACIGQQALRGKRIEKGYHERTLPHFKKGELSPNARGFIRDGFKKGMTPHEYFFAAMTGRDSLMDTALRTPKSGYLYRRLANALQDVKVEYDDTVRDAAEKIIQFEYSEDGIDVSKSEGGIINVDRIIEETK
ncbi:DNA-directed RNA polymerase subunit A' [Candidatus Woesearchaeota archaeon]|nr:DNA-directed RNA polymerase subunit A' [Candidatus Woesearchaeota archaeon]